MIEYHKLLSAFAFNFNLRRYDEEEREGVEREAAQRIHARYQNMENMERMENEEEMEKRLEERYASHQTTFEVGRCRLKPCLQARNKTSLACMTYCLCVLLCDLTSATLLKAPAFSA